jgi:hypothetical protein
VPWWPSWRWRGRIRTDDDAVVVMDPAPTGDELVDELLAGLAAAGGGTLDPPGWLGRVGFQVTPRIHGATLGAQGAIH